MKFSNRIIDGIGFVFGRYGHRRGGESMRFPLRVHLVIIAFVALLFSIVFAIFGLISSVVAFR